MPKTKLPTRPKPSKLWEESRKTGLRVLIGDAYTLDAAAEFIADEWPSDAYTPVLVEPDGTELEWQAGEWVLRIPDESTDLHDDTNIPVPLTILERIYSAAVAADEEGDGGEFNDEILRAITPYLPNETRRLIEENLRGE